jgi:SAM-dependent methyltransferase
MTGRPTGDGGLEPTATARALARLYDLDLVDDPGDLDLYAGLALRADGPILELAAGTGRLAVPLAALGHPVTAVDLDRAMLERAYARAHAAGSGRRGSRTDLDLELIEADLLELDLPGAGRFALTFIALNSLFLLASADAQRTALRVMSRHLAPGGLAVIDIWLPEAEDLARFDGRLIFEYERDEPELGHPVTKVAAARHDPETAIVDLTAIYEEGPSGTGPVRWVRRDALRLVGADELVQMSEAAGLEVEQLGGDYDLAPIGPDTDRAILVARRR